MRKVLRKFPRPLILYNEAILSWEGRLGLVDKLTTQIRSRHLKCRTKVSFESMAI